MNPLRWLTRGRQAANGGSGNGGARSAPTELVPLNEFARNELAAYNKREEIRRRYYTSATSNRFNSYLPSVPQPPLATIRAQLRTLRARSRHEYENNDYMRQIVRQLSGNVIGPKGLTLVAQAINGDGKPDDGANNGIEQTWRRWGEKGTCEITGTLSLRGVQETGFKSLVNDGETFIRKIRDPGVNEYGYALQLIDAELIDVDYNRELQDGSVIICGIEYDKWRRPAAYHVIDYGTTARLVDAYTYAKRDYIPVPAADMVHTFRPESIGQTRGLPWLSTTLGRLAMLEGYEDAAMVAARIGAQQVAYIRRPSGRGYQGEENEQGDLVNELEPGVHGRLYKDEELVEWKPNYPNNELEAFVKWILRGISGGSGVPYTTVANDREGVNYSSGRLDVLDSRPYYRSTQQFFGESFMRPIYLDWLAIQLMRQTIRDPASGRPLPAAKLEKYERVRWQAVRWESVDPQKDAGAAEKHYDLGSTSLTEIASQRGRTVDDIFRERASERATAAKYGEKLPDRSKQGASTSSSSETDSDDKTETEGA